MAIPDLRTTYHVIPDMSFLVFELNKQRTELHMQNRENNADIHVWVGPDPDPDPENWISIRGLNAQSMFDLPNGCYGPILIAEVGSGGGGVTIISPINEVSIVTPLTSLPGWVPPEVTP